MEKLSYILLFGFVRLVALIPFKGLYFLSDYLLFPLIYRVARYRVKVVRQNIAQSFLNKTEAERKAIEVKFYHHFSDYILETIKQADASVEEIMSRMEIKNMELVREWEKKGRSAILMMGHYGNWEWVSSMNYFIQPIRFAQIYRKLKNPTMDRLFLRLRSKYESISIEKKQTLRELMQLKNSGEQTMVCFLSDQTPSPANLIYWTTFLNQDSSILIGAEKIAKKTDFDVFYLDVTKLSRGKYSAEFKLIAENPKQTADFEITEKYARMMEETILRDPAYWLWTHRRWKHRRS